MKLLVFLRDNDNYYSKLKSLCLTFQMLPPQALSRLCCESAEQKWEVLIAALQCRTFWRASRSGTGCFVGGERSLEGTRVGGRGRGGGY